MQRRRIPACMRRKSMPEPLASDGERRERRGREDMEEWKTWISEEASGTREMDGLISSCRREASGERAARRAHSSGMRWAARMQGAAI